MARAESDAPVAFSANFATSGTDLPRITGKLYFSGPNMRIDMTGPAAGTGEPMGDMGLIVDGATKTSYMLMLQQGVYVEYRGNQSESMSPLIRRLTQLQASAADPCAELDAVDCKKVGGETLNDRKCTKWEAVDRNKNKIALWIDDRLHFPIKVIGGDGIVTEFSQIKEGPQNASLFILPPGFKPFDPPRAVKSK